MSGRFRLDPRDAHDGPRPAERTNHQVGPDPKGAEPARPPPTPPVVAPRAAAPPPAPRPAPAPAARADAPAPLWKNRRVLLIGAVVVSLLVIGGAVAFVATALGYPDKYVLEAGEMPAGMSNARLTRQELDDAGMTRNPGPIDRESLEENFGGSDAANAEKAHGQFLQTSQGGKIAIFALQYADEDAARAAAQDARYLCSFANGVVLRDAEVLVAVFPNDGASPSSADAVGRALMSKTKALDDVCGL